ncbi:MAG: aryl-sulfate sulfotransferase, partial [Candidatus Thorarchaeota archaeon]
CNRTTTRQLPAILLVMIFLITLIPPTLNPSRAEDSSQPVLLDSTTNLLESDVVLDRVDYSVYNSVDSYDGYNFFSLYDYDRTRGNTSNIVLITDMDGNILAKHQLGQQGGAHCSAEFINPETVIVGSSQGATLWFWKNDTFTHLGFGGHHEYEYNPNDNTIFTFHRQRRTVGSYEYIFDTIQEFSMNGTLVWDWNVSDFISEQWWCPYHDIWDGARDLTHSNTIYYVPDEDIIYYNSRNTNTFFKLNHTAKEVIWGLGQYGNFTLYDLQGYVRDELFYHAHAVEPVDENTFILFDNDYHNISDAANRMSRIVEITIDEDTMTAHESWYYEAPTNYYSTGWGDADRLPNGNRLGAWGYPSTPVGGPSAALIEVNPDHKVVWKMSFEFSSTHLYGVYRMERFRFAPIISQLDDIVSANRSFTLSWDALYNYRNKQNIPGNYTLYINDVPSQTGSFNFTKYWRPSTITIDTGTLDFGTNNVTLEISDGTENKNSDSVMITVEPFQISRTGRTSIEKGQTEQLPSWSGFTAIEMFCNVTLDGSLYEEANWTGQTIVLNPALIDLGVHTVHFQLFNGSTVIFDDTFLLTVYPTEPPLITPLQSTNLTILWGDSLSLSWNLSDSTPNIWSILIDDVETGSGLWNESIYTLNWEVPTLSEGFHNITLVAFDLATQWTSSMTNLTVDPPILPFILLAPENQIIAWGTSGVTLEWETYNAETWSLWRNGTLIGSGDASLGDIVFSITDWYDEGWLAGTYNMTLSVVRGEFSSSDSFWLEISSDPGDQYADAVVVERSESYLYGNNSLGPPDGRVAIIFVDYQSGYLTLDMGINEEVVDGLGDDIMVYADGGEYLVSVSDSLFDFFTYIGSGIGNQGFDLEPSGITQARFVRITYSVGEDTQLDAVEALHYNVPPIDSAPPYLVAHNNETRIEIGESTLITWFAYDETPWSYEIYVDSQLEVTEFWNGSNINYLFEPPTVGLWNVTVIAYDIFGNSANSTTLVNVYNPNSPLILLIGGAGIAGLTVVVVVIWMKKKKVS